MSGLGYILLDLHSNAQENRSDISAKRSCRRLLANHKMRVTLDGTGISILNNNLFSNMTASRMINERSKANNTPNIIFHRHNSLGEMTQLAVALNHDGIIIR